MSLNQRNLDNYLQEIQKLWNDWDPIGALPIENDIYDEYDLYLGLSFLLLKQNATTAEIENYLILVLGEFMGFDDAHIKCCKPNDFAIELQIWFKNLEKV